MSHGVAKGKTTGSWKTWVIRSADQFPFPAPAEPGSAQSQQQLDLVKNAFEGLTEEQKRLIVTWSAGSGTKTEAGLLTKMVSDYMEKKQINLVKRLTVLSVLAMGLADASIAANHYKYIYWAKRPFMLDDTIKTYMPTPNHPSYPSSSAALAGAFQIVLHYYFPEEKIYWKRVMRELIDSRVWSGIHFPQDVEEGFTLGERIGGYILERIK